MLDKFERSRGCLLGGGVGDALGAPVEFMDMAAIESRFGPGGIRDFVPAYGRIGAITDDTQMTLFTAEGLLRSQMRFAARGICHVPTMIHDAYLRWLKTQGESSDIRSPQGDNWQVASGGWLIEVRALWSRRAPGNTCLSALRATQRLGEPATNNSKGCGGVMRAAPLGLIAKGKVAFRLGCESAALTHGHPSGILSAGFLALLIAELMTGLSLRAAIDVAKATLSEQAAHEEVLRTVEEAERLACLQLGASLPPTLGQGWVAEEALAIAVYCALSTVDFEQAVLLAVNHSGDSDSTGAITGNLCGTLYGLQAIPERWLSGLELRDEITAIADDLAGVREGSLDLFSERMRERYPGY